MSQSTSPHSWRSDWDREAKQPGLEVGHTWVNAKHSDQAVNQPGIEAYSLPEGDRHHRRVCGLRPAIFCLVLLLIVVIFGGAIGGGIGGWIATHPSIVTTTTTSQSTPGPSTTFKSTTGPTESALASGSSTHNGRFNLRIVNATTANTQDEGAVYCGSDAKFPCVYTLTDGTMVDREGYIRVLNCNDHLIPTVDSSDGCNPLTKFSVYSNGSLAVGGNAFWYYCFNESWDSKGFFTEPKSSKCYPTYLTVADV